jgi:osmotically-inducible protein OsmY
MKRRVGHEAKPRTDSQIFIDARNALDHRPSIPAAVRVHVDEGIVTLTGPVRWPAERAEAESVAQEAS